jgi:hypothetical protein
MSSLLDARRLEDERVELSSRRSGVMEALEEVQQKFEACKVNDFHYIFFVLNLTLLHLPPLRFQCADIFDLLDGADGSECRPLTLKGDERRRWIFSCRPSK